MMGCMMVGRKDGVVEVKVRGGLKATLYNTKVIIERYFHDSGSKAIEV